MKDAPVEMGKGPVITIVDSSGRGLIASRKVVSWLKEAADADNIPVQLEVGSGGTTDATAIHLTKGGIPSTTLSIASRYIHSPVEVLDLKDIEAGVELLVTALKKKPAL
jgi:putative aminopeptidase FrvX